MPARFFPTQARYFPGQRWLNILLRAAHLIGVAGIGGGFLFAVEESLWRPWWWLTLVTGVLLSLLYLYSDGRWLLQLKGQVILLKLILLALAFALPPWRAELFVLVILLSALIAHAPGAVRGYSGRLRMRRASR
ncbi:MAG: hypothetical protein ACQETD_04000 [Pseudomonadota bacterium]